MRVLSIIIPVYNVAPYLRECLDSVLAQTYTDWEAICVDDGSTDGSGAILDEYAARDSRFRVIHQMNSGVAIARSVGIAEARGEYVGWVDSDDYVEPVHFAGLISVAETSGADIVWSDHKLIKDSSICEVNHSCEENPDVLLAEILMRKQMGSLWDKIFKRSFVENVGADFGIGKCTIMEDNFFLYKLLINNPKVKHSPQSTYHYFVRNGSLSNKGETTEWWQQVIDANNAIYDMLLGKCKDGPLKYRMAMFKWWLLNAPAVTDEMFYGFMPQIKNLPLMGGGRIASLKECIKFAIASRGLRKVFVR